MNEILQQIENGDFIQGDCYIVLKSGVRIWTANGTISISFHPHSGKDFTLFEKIKIAMAIKKGRIKQALLKPPTTETN